MRKPIIRPSYRNNVLQGFAIHVFNQHQQAYEPVGQPFALYKIAALTRQAIIDAE